MKSNQDRKEILIDGVNSAGKIHKAKGKVQRGCSNPMKEESIEIKNYISKLQTVLPLTPKDKKLTKVEVISYAIDYIRALRVTLGLSACDEEIHEGFCSVTSRSDEETGTQQQHYSDIAQHQDMETDLASVCLISPQGSPLCIISSPRNSPSPNGCGVQQEAPVNLSHTDIIPAV